MFSITFQSIGFMGHGKEHQTPEENERRAKIRGLLQTSGISSMDDIRELFKETIAEFMVNGLEAELDDKLSYSSKTLRTSFGDADVPLSRDRKGEFEPQDLKKNQTSVSRDIEEKIILMYAKGMTTGDNEIHMVPAALLRHLSTAYYHSLLKACWLQLRNTLGMLAKLWRKSYLIIS